MIWALLQFFLRPASAAEDYPQSSWIIRIANLERTLTEAGEVGVGEPLQRAALFHSSFLR